MTKQTIEITPEVIEKAFETLGIERSQSGNPGKTEEEKAEEAFYKDMTKDEQKKYDAMSDEDKATYKATSASKKDKKEEIQKAIELKKAEQSELEKQLESVEKGEEPKKPEESEISKGIEELLKSQHAEIDNKLSALAIINKGLSDKVNGLVTEIEQQKEELKKANEEIEKLQDEPLPVKSVQSAKYMEKFIEKAHEEGKTVLSVSNPEQRRQIVNKLDEIAKSKNGEQVYSDAVIDLEGGGFISKGIVDELGREHGIAVIS